MDHTRWWMGIPYLALILPLAGMAIAAFAMWLSHRRSIATLELLRTYAAQGKEPPAEIAGVLQNARLSFGDRRYRQWRQAIVLGSLAAAFAGLAYFSEGNRPHHGFVVAGVIVGALALGYALSALVHPRHDGR
jgi:hypothetical protein